MLDRLHSQNHDKETSLFLIPQRNSQRLHYLGNFLCLTYFDLSLRSSEFFVSEVVDIAILDRYAVTAVHHF